MPLNKETLKASIVAIMNDMLTREETSIEEFADRLSTAIDNYVKEAKINYISGLATATGGGPVTGVFNGNLS
jgi:hypothetical protein